MLGFINQGIGRLDDAACVLDDAVAYSARPTRIAHLFVAMNKSSDILPFTIRA
jgi:hypothetical protein